MPNIVTIKELKIIEISAKEETRNFCKRAKSNMKEYIHFDKDSGVRKVKSGEDEGKPR